MLSPNIFFQLSYHVRIYAVSCGLLALLPSMIFQFLHPLLNAFCDLGISRECTDASQCPTEVQSSTVRESLVTPYIIWLSKDLPVSMHLERTMGLTSKDWLVRFNWHLTFSVKTQ